MHKQALNHKAEQHNESDKSQLPLAVTLEHHEMNTHRQNGYERTCPWPAMRTAEHGSKPARLKQNKIEKCFCHLWCRIRFRGQVPTPAKNRVSAAVKKRYALDVAFDHFIELARLAIADFQPPREHVKIGAVQLQLSPSMQNIDTGKRHQIVDGLAD